MANRRRPEVDFVIAGRKVALRLTLRGLAEIEDALGARSLAELGGRLGGGLRAADLIPLLGAAVRGGGEAMDDEAIAAAVPASDLPRVAAALAELLALTFAPDDDPPDAPRPPPPQDA
jgi:hypothetical protein